MEREINTSLQIILLPLFMNQQKIVFRISNLWGIPLLAQSEFILTLLVGDDIHLLWP